MSKKQHSDFAFQVSMLPKNRKEVFQDVLKLHKRILFLTGVVLFLFSLPLQFSLYLKDMTISSIYQQYNQGIISVEDAQAALLSYSNVFSLVNILLLMIFGVGLSGVVRIIKSLSWYEPVTFFDDFSKGISENGIQYTLLFLIIGILSFVSKLISNLASLISIDSLYSYLGMIPGLVFSIIFIPVGIYMMTVIVIYKNPFRSQIRLSLYLYFSTIIQSIKWIFILSIPFFILLIPNFYVTIIGRIALMFVIPFLYLKWFLVSSDIIDQKWNIHHYPKLVNKGVLGATKKNKNVKEV
ncbi:MAG: hypothetical protein ACVCEJ_04175 [Candidatus Izemoplasmataceae bacterium]